MVRPAHHEPLRRATILAHASLDTRPPWPHLLERAGARAGRGGGLDEVGRAQVTALTKRLAAEPITAVYASPAWRARQTAQPLADALGLPLRRRRLLRDLDYGRYAGAFVADVVKEDPDLFHRWRTEPHTVTFDGGENLAALRGAH